MGRLDDKWGRLIWSERIIENMKTLYISDNPWMEAAVLCCADEVALVNRGPRIRKRIQVATQSTSSAGCKLLNNEQGKNDWEKSISRTGGLTARAREFLVYSKRSTALPQFPSSACGAGTWQRDTEETPMAAAEVVDECAAGNKSKGTEAGGVCEEDLHSCLGLFWGIDALPIWKDVFC